MGTDAEMGPGACFLLTSGSAVLPHVDFAHVGAGRICASLPEMIASIRTK